MEQINKREQDLRERENLLRERELKSAEDRQNDNQSEVSQIATEERTIEILDSNLNDEQKRTLHLNTAVKDLNKYTKNMEKYEQDSIENFRKFNKQLRSTFRKLTRSENQNFTFDQVISGEVKLSMATRELLTFVIDDFVEGIAAETTKSSREEFDFIQTYSTLRSAWPKEDINAKAMNVRRDY